MSDICQFECTYWKCGTGHTKYAVKPERDVKHAWYKFQQS